MANLQGNFLHLHPINPTIPLNLLKPKPPMRRKPDPLTLTTIIPPCTECGKGFASWKALFGHMRCHPERQWRGINPPPNCQSGGVTHIVIGFSNEEFEVAASLVMLANGVVPENKNAYSCFGLDLNFPPPPPLLLEIRNEGLDLRLRM